LYQKECWAAFKEQNDDKIGIEEGSLAIREAWNTMEAEEKEEYRRRAAEFRAEQERLFKPQNEKKKRPFSKPRPYDQFRKQHWDKNESLKENMERIATLWKTHKDQLTQPETE